MNSSAHLPHKAQLACSKQTHGICPCCCCFALILQQDSASSALSFHCSAPELVDLAKDDGGYQEAGRLLCKC